MLECAELQNLQCLAGSMKEHAFSKIVFYIVKTKASSISVRRGAVTKREAEDVMYSIEANYRGKKSRIYTNQLTDHKTIMETMKMTAEVYEVYQEHLWNEACMGEDSHSFYLDRAKDIIPVLEAAEQEAYKSEAVHFVQKCCYEQRQEEIFLLDEQMNVIQDVDGYHCFQFGVISRKGNDVGTAAKCTYGTNLSQIEVEACVTKTVAEAVEALGGTTLASGEYEVILSGQVMAELVEAYIPAFYADNIQNQMSSIGGQNREAIAASHLHLKEIPQFVKGRHIRSLDDEGVAVTEKYLLRNGFLEQILYNRSAAEKEEVQSTGNGFRSSIQSDIEIGVTNVVFGTENAEKMKTQTEMEEMLQDGLLITNVDGVFAGTNSKTGTFSLIAAGRIIQNGSIQGAFREVTIAGNFFELLKNISYVGHELESTWPESMCVLSPAVIAGKIMVSGT